MRERNSRYAIIQSFVLVLVLLSTELSGEEQVLELAPYVVRAWHFDGLAMNAPGQVTVLDRTVIAGAQVSNIPDLLSQEANIRFESTTGKGTHGQLSLRGFGENSGMRVLVLMDGQRMNRADMGGIEWHLLPLDAIAGIEVIRGGQNVLYGNHALAGVIDITTRRGGTTRNSVRVEAGSDGYFMGSAHTGGGTNRWFWDTTIAGTEDQGYRENARSWSRGISTALGYWLSEDRLSSLSARLTASKSYTQYPGPLLWQQVQDNARQSTSAGDEESIHENGMISVLWQRRSGGIAKQVNSNFQVRNMEWSLGGIHARNDQWAASLHPRIRFGGDETFVLGGVDLNFDRIDFHSYLDPDQNWLRARAKLTRFNVGPYAFGQLTLTETLMVSGGVRIEGSHGAYGYDAYVENQILPTLLTNRGPIPNPNYRNPPDLDPSKSYDRKVNKTGTAASLSLLWRVHERVSAWGGVNRVYRYPGIDETAAFQGVELTQPVNADLDPETGSQVDAGIKYRSRHASVALTLYQLNLKGEIIFDNAASLNVNMADTRRNGVELEFGWEKKRWSLTSKWAWVDAQFRDGPNIGKTVPLVPEAHTTTSLKIRPLEWLETTIVHQWSAKRYQGNDFDNSLPGIASFHRVDLLLSTDWNTISAFVRINNILDHTYAPLAFRGGYYPAPGRQWRAGITYQF
ncbi:MAG: TonB-dependent receptor [Verrucomicrobia bacterium]|nr:TonB-dependent receptor [Verrucomicrobiota bacterium]